MPKLIKSAHRLYLAEAAALAAPTNLDISVLLAAATHMRHKFAEHALRKMFASAEKTDENTILRKILVFRLVLCAQAAYEDIKPLFTTPNLAAAEVKPYYAKKTYRFGSIYNREPLNLFPGLSTENLKNSSQVIDPRFLNQVKGSGLAHRFPIEQSGTINKGLGVNQGYPTTQSGTTSPTKTSGTMQIESPNSKAIEDTFPITTNWYGDVTEEYENSCSVLDILLKNEPKIFEKIHCSKIRQILDDLKSMSDVSKQLTASGKDHYDQLLKNLGGREKEFSDRDKNDEFSACFNRLDVAREQWVSFRKNLDTSISELLNEATPVGTEALNALNS
ncbi:hypothetical protein [Burkholderia glumae]|uniref:hypothetical protein n=1 Tax=Burkholderia glumae TaxID=337 RepID=UPI003B99EBF1